jgi:hypothetical protein
LLIVVGKRIFSGRRRPVIVIKFHLSNYQLPALHADTDRYWIEYSFDLLSGRVLASLAPMVPSMPDKEAMHNACCMLLVGRCTAYERSPSNVRAILPTSCSRAPGNNEKIGVLGSQENKIKYRF